MHEGVLAVLAEQQFSSLRSCYSRRCPSSDGEPAGWAGANLWLRNEQQ